MITKTYRSTDEFLRDDNSSPEFYDMEKERFINTTHLYSAQIKHCIQYDEWCNNPPNIEQWPLNYIFLVKMSPKEFNDIIEWLANNTKHNYHAWSWYVVLEDHEEAIQFKLRWS